jgi:RNA recognition motif-containing protein
MRLYIGNLDYAVTEGEVKECFVQFGAVHECYVPLSEDGSRNRGIAFVKMSEETALEALAELHGQMWGRRRMCVEIARPRAGHAE